MAGGCGAVRWSQKPCAADRARDAVDTRGLNSLGEGHGRQDGGEPSCQHRFPCSRRSKEKDILGRTPASRSPSPLSLQVRVPVTADLHCGERSGLPTCGAPCAVPAGVPYASHAATSTPPLSGRRRSRRADPLWRVAVFPPLSPLVTRCGSNAGAPGRMRRWHGQPIEADTVIRQTGMLPRSSLLLRQPAPCR
jgi:hypothetical protein